MASSDYDKSVQQLTMAIERNPRDERSHLARARVLSLSGRDADAQRALVETIQAFPDSSLAHWWLALHMSDSIGTQTRGEKLNTRLRVPSLDGRALYSDRSPRRRRHRRTGCGRRLHACDRCESERFGRTQMLAGALLQQDRVNEAFIEFVATLMIDPLDADAHARIGRIHLDAGRRYADAAEALRRAVESEQSYRSAICAGHSTHAVGQDAGSGPGVRPC